MSAQREIGKSGAYRASAQSVAARLAPAIEPDIARPEAPLALPLDDAERVRFRLVGALASDEAGLEYLRGLSRAESLEYVELQRRGLDNDDAAFLRYILLGDRIAVAAAQHRG